MRLVQEYSQELYFFEEHLKKEFISQPQDYPGVQIQLESIRYSLNTGGKRFRPLLSLLVAKTLNQPLEKALGWAMAVECIHTYSMIHDDLPCMDDDDFRRGQPTNHKKFGEATALLAGDSLLTFAFQKIALHYSAQPIILAELVRLLSESAGVWGMIGGQAMDIEDKPRDLQELLRVHELKTGALIEAAVMGAAVACEDQELSRWKEFGSLLGLAFQLADDILDYDEEQPERTSVVTLMGLEATKNKLREVTDQALFCLSHWGNSAHDLVKMVDYNQNRTQ